MLAFPTRASAQAATIALAVNTLLVSGYAAAGDAPLAAYVRIPCTAVVAWGFQSADKLDSGGATCTGTNINWLLNVPEVYAQHLGAKCDSSTNDSTAFQNAINAGIALGKAVRFYSGSGYCTLVTGLTINNAIDFGGSYTGMSSMIAPGAFTKGAMLYFAAGVTGIGIDTNKAFKLHDFAITLTSAGAASTGIIVTSTSGAQINDSSRIENLYMRFDNAFNGACLIWQKASRFTIANSSFTECQVSVQNTTNVDIGDSIIYGSEFNMTAAQIPFVYKSSGGLKFNANKINGGSICFQMLLDPAAVTSVLSINGGSLEGCDTVIDMRRAGATGTFNAVQITGVEIGGLLDGIIVPLDASGLWLSGLTISGNTILCTRTCVNINSARAINITGNVLFNAGGGTPDSIILGASAANAMIGTNVKLGTFNPYSVASSVTEVVSMTSQAAASVSACGAGPAGSVTGTMAGGRIAIGGGATACTLSFGESYTAKVSCSLSNQAGTGVIFTVPALTGILITGGVAAGNIVHYVCNGY
jgi:hypothetical protein